MYTMHEQILGVRVFKMSFHGWFRALHRAIQKDLVVGHAPLAFCATGSASISQELYGAFDSLTAMDSRRFRGKGSDVQYV